MNDAVIYTRLSSAREGDTDTLANQEDVCRGLAASNSLVVVRVFSEGSGVSAFKKGSGRPELGALRAHVKTNPGTTVISWEVSRLTRRLSDLSGWIDLVDDFEARIITPEMDTSQSGGRLMLSIMASMAEEESRQKSSRIKEGKNRQRQAGKHLGGYKPAGYRSGPDGSLEIDPVGAEVLRQAIGMYLDDGLSMRAVCLKLNSEKVLTPSGKLWSTPYLRRALVSPIAAGVIEQADGSLKAAAGLEAGGIISLARLREAKLRVESRSARSNKPARRPAATLLSAGILRCHSCLGGMTLKRNSKGAVTYRCKRSGTGSCSDGVAIRAHLVEPFAIIAVLQRIKSAQAAAAGGDWTAFDLIFSNFQSLINPEHDLLRAQLETELAELLQRQETMTDLFVGGTLAAEAYQRGIAALTGRLAAAESALAALPDTSQGQPLPIDGGVWLTQLAEGEIIAADLPAAFETACGSLAVARNVLRSVITSITVHPYIHGKPATERLTVI
jgi:DNA invertase Pin-like site-specific DNA recombinase